MPGEQAAAGQEGAKAAAVPDVPDGVRGEGWGSPFPSKIKRRGSYKAIWHSLAGFQTYQIRIVVRYLEHRYLVCYQITL